MRVELSPHHVHVWEDFSEGKAQRVSEGIGPGFVDKHRGARRAVGSH